VIEFFAPEQECVDGLVHSFRFKRVLRKGHELAGQALEGLADSSVGKILTLFLGQATLLVFLAAAARACGVP
jgi:hypothetical protein